MGELYQKDPKSIASEVNAIAKHLAEVAKHHQHCVAEGNTFENTLATLAKSNPEALKAYVEPKEKTFKMSVEINGGRIVGYHADTIDNDPDYDLNYVRDPGLNDYISGLTAKRVKACDSLFR